MASRSYGPKDDQPLDDGDAQFLRFASRGDGFDLPQGVLRYSENLRLTAKTIRPRKGAKALATDLQLTNPPVILDFTLGADLALASLTRSGGTATATTVDVHGYTTGDLVAIEHADQPEYNGDFTITVTGAKTFTFAVSGSPASPATGAITANKGPQIFDVYSDVVRGSGPYTSDDNVDGIILATANAGYVCRAGQATVKIDYPAGEHCDGPAALEQFEGKVYLFRGAPALPVKPVLSLTLSGSNANVTVALGHGLATGDWIFMEGVSPVDYNGVFQVTVTGPSTFTYPIAGSPASPTGTPVYRKCAPVMVWDRNLANDFTIVPSGAHPLLATFIRMPPVDWGIAFNRRLWVPFARDQILGTDYSDASTIDTDAAEARIRPGGADWLVGAMGFSRTRLFIAYRKTMHLMELNISDLSIGGIDQIEGEFGCAARMTIKNCGGQILFLTDKGVARLVITPELNVVADTIALSDDVQDQFDRINWAAAEAAVAAYHDNRYYLALPIDGSPVNNAIFIYSFLNGGGWETIDRYPGDFDVQALHLATYEGKLRLHVVTTYGALYLLEEGTADEFGAGDEITSNPIVAVAKTRYLRQGTSDVKRWLRALVELQVDAGDALQVAAAVRNPDQTAQVLDLAATATDDQTRRPRIGRRGVACSLEITTSGGRPEVKSITLESNLTDTSSKSR